MAKPLERALELVDCLGNVVLTIPNPQHAPYTLRMTPEPEDRRLMLKYFEVLNKVDWEGLEPGARLQIRKGGNLEDIVITHRGEAYYEIRIPKMGILGADKSWKDAVLLVKYQLAQIDWSKYVDSK